MGAKSVYKDICATFVILTFYGLLIFGLVLCLIYIIHRVLFANGIDYIFKMLIGAVVVSFFLIYISKKFRHTLEYLNPRWYLKKTGWKECELPNWIFNKFYTITGHGWTDNMHYEELVNSRERVYFKGKHFEYLVGKGEIWRRKRK